MSLTIVIPTFNEANNSIFLKNLEMLQKLVETEVIITDGNSSDDTLNIAHSYNYKVLQKAGPTRAERINTGLKFAKKEMILIVHPRSLLTLDALSAVQSLSSQKIWGGLTHSFDNKSALFKFTSWYSNNIRAKLKGIIYLDHCIFLHRSFHQAGKPLLPKTPIFEDTELSKSLKKICKPIILKENTITSAIRFEKNGFFKQSLKNFVLKTLYGLNLSGDHANAYYENNMNLNNIYDK